MDSVKVAIRIRPLINRELGSEPLWTADTHQVKQKDGKGKAYIFDRVFDSDEETRDVYEEIVEPIVKSAMEGFNGTVFAYGQTSSGKTYTMMGEKMNPGIIPLSVRETFNSVQKTPEREFLMRVSYMEIYNEVVKDLLTTGPDGPGLQIREDEFRNAVVQNLTEKLVRTPEEVMKLMDVGEKRRHTGCTNMNERSSRSHTIFRMIIESRERATADTTRDSIDVDTAVQVSQLNLVDLAGSERASQTGAEGQRLKEGCHINKSLSTLGLVINQICKAVESGKSAAFISYRDSKLTRILQPSLGGNSLTAIICAITPASLEDSDSTLRFASSAKKIKNDPHVNEVLTDEALLFRQKREINQLKKKIQEMELKAKRQKTVDIDEVLREKNELQKEQAEKIQMLKNIILVSSQPADFSKQRQRARRETWCPGKHAAAMFPPVHRSPEIDRTLVNQSIRMQAFDQSLLNITTKQSPTGKRTRFLENPEISNKKLKTGFSLTADDDVTHATIKFTNLEDEVIQMRKRQENLEDELAEARSQKNKHLREKESLNMKVMRLQGQISDTQEALDDIVAEKSTLEDEKSKLESQVKDKEAKITDYMRKERHWQKSNPDATALYNENQDLCDQLADVCGQNRRLQEKADAKSDSIEYLESMLEQTTKEVKEKEETFDSQLSEYKHQVSILQSQLEATFANGNSPTSLVDAGKLELEMKDLKCILDKRDSELEEERRKNQDLISELEDIKTSKQDETSRWFSTEQEEGSGVGEKQDVEENSLLKKLQIRDAEIELLQTGMKGMFSKDDYDAITRKLEDKDLENEALREQVEAMFSERAGELNDSLQQQLENKQEENQHLIKELEELKAKGVAKSQEEDVVSDASTLPQDVDELNSKIKQLQEELIIKDAELDEMKRASEQQASFSNRTAEDSVKFGEKTMGDTIATCEVLVEQRDTARSECEKLRQELESLKDHASKSPAKSDKADLDESIKIGEKTMMLNEAFSTCEEMMEERNEARQQCKKLEERVEELQHKLQEQAEDMVRQLQEKEEFLKFEREIFSEHSEDNDQTIASLQESLTQKESELEQLRRKVSLDTDDSFPKDIGSSDSDNRETKDLKEEIESLVKSSADAQEMLQEKSRDLALANDVVSGQKKRIEELEKEMKLVKSDVESFDTLAELTKEKYETRERELTQQLQEAYDTLGGAPPSEPSEKRLLAEKEAILSQKDDEIQDLVTKLAASSSRLSELENEIQEYKRKLEELESGTDSSTNQDAGCSELQQFMLARNLSLDELKVKLDALEDLKCEKGAILLEMETKEAKISELETLIQDQSKDVKTVDQETSEQIDQKNEKISELESMIQNLKKDAAVVEELQDAMKKLEEKLSEKNLMLNEQESVSSAASSEKILEIQRELQIKVDAIDELEKSLQHKDEETVEVQKKLEEAESLVAQNDHKLEKLEEELRLAGSKSETLQKQLDEVSSSSEDSLEKSLREQLVNARRELADLNEKYSKLQTVTEHTQGALLAETNRELDQQRLLQNAERRRRESAMEFASERESANKKIDELLNKVAELETQLCKLNVEKDIAARNGDKLNQECEFLRQQVKQLENIHEAPSVIPRNAAMDPDKMAVRIKQLSLNLELTKQTSEKLTVTNQKLQDENRRLEGEILQTVSLKGEVTRLQAILDNERKVRQEADARMKMRDSEVEEMRTKIIDLQKQMQEAKSEFNKRSSEASENLDEVSKQKRIMEEEVEDLKQKITTLQDALKASRLTEEDANSNIQKLQDDLASHKFMLEEAETTRKADAERLESLQDGIKHFQQKLEEDKSKLKEAEEQNISLLKDLDDVKEELEEKLRRLEEETHKNGLLHQDLDSAKKELESVKSETEDAKSAMLLEEQEKMEELSSKLEEVQKEFRESLEKVHNLEATIANLNSEGNIQKDVIQQLEEQLKGMSEERVDIENVVQKDDDAETEVYILKERLCSLEEDLQKKKENYEEKIIHLQTLQEDSLNAKAEIEKILQETTTEKEVLQEKITILEKELGELKCQPSEVCEDAERDDLRNKIADLEAELEEMIIAKEEAVRMQEGAAQEHKHIVDELNENIRRLSEENPLGNITELEASLAAKQDEIEEYMNQVSKLKSKDVSRVESLSRKQEELDECRKQISMLESKCSELESTGRRESQKQTENDDGVGFAADLDQELIDNLSDQVADLRIQLQEKDEEIEELVKTVESLKKNIPPGGQLENGSDVHVKDLEKKIEELSSSLDAKENRIVDLEKMVQDAEAKLSNNGDGLNQDAKLQNPPGDCDLEEKIKVLKSELSSKDAVIVSIQETKKELEEKLSSAASQLDKMQDPEEQVLQLTSDVTLKEEEIDRLCKLKEDLEERLDLARRQLEEGQNERSTDENAEKHTNLDLHNRIELLMADVASRDVEILDLKKMKDEPDMKLSGDKLESDQTNDLQEQILKLTDELSNKDEEISNLLASKKEQEENLTQLQSLRSSEMEEVAEMKSQLLQLQKSLENENSRISDMKRLKEEAEKRLEILSKEKEDSSRLSTDLMDSLKSEHEKEISRMKEEVDNVKLRLEEMSREKQYLEEKCKCLQDSLSCMETMIEELQGTKKEYSTENSKLLEEITSLKEDKEKLGMQNNDLDSQIENLKSDVASKEESRLEEVSMLQAEIEIQKEEASSTKSELESLLTVIKEKASEMEEFASSRESLEREVENLSKENEVLKASINDAERMTALQEEYKENMKRVENTMENLAKELAEVTDAKDAIEAELKETSEQKKELEMKIQEFEKSHQDDLNQEKERFSAMEEECSQLQETLQTVTETKDQKAEEVATLKQELAALEKHLKDVEADKKTDSEEVVGLKKRAEDVKVQHESEVNELKEAVYNKELEAEAMKAEMERCVEVAENATKERDMDVKESRDKYEALQKEHDQLEAQLKSLAQEKSDISVQLSALEQKHSDAVAKHDAEMSELKKSSSRKESEDVENLKEKLIENQKEFEKQITEVKGLLYKKELEVQSLQTEIGDWGDKYEQLKSDLESAAANAKQEILQQNEESSAKIFELEQKLQEASEHAQKTTELKQLRSETEQRCREEKEKMDEIETLLEKEKENYSLLLAEKDSQKQEMDELASRFTKTQTRLKERISSLEDNLFELDKELEEEKKKSVEWEKKWEESEKRETRSGATRTRASSGKVSELESIREVCNKTEEKYKEEKQKVQNLKSQVKAERQRCAQLVSRLEDATMRKEPLYPPMDASDAAKELYMERDKCKKLLRRVSDLEKDMKEQSKQSEEKVKSLKKRLDRRIDDLQDKCFEADQEIEQEKKKCENLEKKYKLAQQATAVNSQGNTTELSTLKETLEEKENVISDLKRKLVNSTEPLEKELSEVKADLQESEEKVLLLKQKLGVVADGEEEPVGKTSGSSSIKASLRSASTSFTYHGGSGGLVVKDTKVYVLQMEISELQKKRKYLEKELAKYKDIETKRRAENMELLEENKKFRSIIKSSRHKKAVSENVLTENPAVMNKASQSKGSDNLLESHEGTPTHQDDQGEKCKNQ